MKSSLPSILLCAILPLTAHVRADVIYREDFKGLATEELAGTEPAITTAGATWSARSIFKKDGSVTPRTVLGSAYLPFVPSSGKVYILKGDLITGGDSDRWVALGFFSNAFPEVRHSEDGLIWVLHRLSEEEPNQSAFLSAPFKKVLFHSEVETRLLEVEIILDTTSEENVLLTINLNGTATDVSGQDIGALKHLGIKAVGISYCNRSPGSFGNFELSSKQ